MKKGFKQLSQTADIIAGFIKLAEMRMQTVEIGQQFRVNGATIRVIKKDIDNR